MTNCWGIVPAAGIGRRMDAAQAKQYLSVAGKHIIEYSIAPLLQCLTIGKIIVAVNEDDTHWQNLTIKDDPRIETCQGGASRALSVRNALTQLKAESKVNVDDWVIIHDAVRPCLKNDDLEHLIRLTWLDPIGAILAISISDSIKRVQRTAERSLHVVETLARGDLWVRAATPQMFRYQLLCDALDNALADGLDIDDEAVAMQHAGHEVKVILSDNRNIKLTYQVDLENIKLYLSDREL